MGSNNRKINYVKEDHYQKQPNTKVEDYDFVKHCLFADFYPFLDVYLNEFHHPPTFE